MDTPQNNTPQADTPSPATTDTKPEISKALSQVANLNTRNIRLIIGIMASIMLVLFLLFSGTKKKGSASSNVTMVQPNMVVRPQQDLVDLPPIPKAPPIAAPKISTTTSAPTSVVTAPEPTPATPIQGTTIEAPKVDIQLPNTNNLSTTHNKNSVQARHRSSIMLINNIDKTSTPHTKPHTKEIEEVVVQQRHGAGDILPKGKIIEAVLETALDTAIGGEVKAMVITDVYDDKGCTILIPRGSIVFGVYNDVIESTYDRINIAWKRIDLPTGYLIDFDGIAVDNHGRKGIAGRYDGRYKEQLVQLAASSALNIGVGAALDNIVPQSLSVQQQNINNAWISNIRSKTFAAFNSQNYTSDQKIAEICSIVRSEIVDKTSTFYKNFDNACNSLALNVGIDSDQKLISIMTSVNTTIDQLSQSTVQSAATTKVQEAANQSFNHAQSTIKNMINQSRLIPVITVDSGEKVRIFVNKDYSFPKNITEHFLIIQ